jgi:hypothetical protein
MMRYIERDWNKKIKSSYLLPQQNMRLELIDDQSEEYKAWENMARASAPQEPQLPKPSNGN